MITSPSSAMNRTTLTPYWGILRSFISLDSATRGLKRSGTAHHGRFLVLQISRKSSAWYRAS